MVPSDALSALQEAWEAWDEHPTLRPEAAAMVDARRAAAEALGCSALVLDWRLSLRRRMGLSIEEAVASLRSATRARREDDDPPPPEEIPNERRAGHL